MNRNRYTYLLVLVLMISILACSISNVSRQIQSAEQTAIAVKTKVVGIVNIGSSMLKTVRALETRYPGALETAQAIATQGEAMISTIQAVATYEPGLVQTAQAVVKQEMPTGEPPTDIPILSRDQVYNFLGFSQYIFYTSPTSYSQVLEFYETKMPLNGWQFLQDDSHEYANAAQLVYFKGNRIATVNLSLNPLNQTSVVVINILSH